MCVRSVAISKRCFVQGRLCQERSEIFVVGRPGGDEAEDGAAEGFEGFRGVGFRV